MIIAIGSDRRGYKVKTLLQQDLSSDSISFIDVGPFDDCYPVDYPIYGKKVGETVVNCKADYGVVICSTGIGIMIAANKVKGIRCGIAYSDEVARLMREHNDANVIAFGQDYMNYDDIKNRLTIFLNTKYLGQYHDTRVKQLSDIEKGLEIQQTPFMKSF